MTIFFNIRVNFANKVWPDMSCIHANGITGCLTARSSFNASDTRLIYALGK